MAYLYDLTDTWNAAGTVFNAIRMNVTNSASAVGSKIVSLQVGSTDRFTVDKDGNGYFSGTLQTVGSVSSPNVYISGNSGTIGMQDNTASILAYNGTGSGGITNALRFITSATERMRIDSSGNVGIGTNAPGTRLDVIGNATFGRGGGTFQGITLTNGDNSASAETVSFIDARNNIGTADGHMFFAHQTDGGSFISWATTAPGARNTDRRAERMRITPTGNVGIGTSAPGAKLQINVQDGFRFDVEAGAASTMRFGSALTGEATGAMAFTRTTGAITFSAGSTGSALSELVRITGTGNVGIGTSAPGYKLTVAGTTNQLSLTTGTNELIARASSSEAALYTFQAIPLNFYTNNAERMRITSDGNVGIGTSAPGYKLDVRGGTSSFEGSSGIGAVRIAGAGGSWFWIDNPSTTILRFSSGASAGTNPMTFTDGGSLGIGTSSPNGAARLEVASTTSGFLPPRMTTAQRDAISTPPNGLMLYNTSTDKLQVRAAGSWVDLH